MAGPRRFHALLSAAPGRPLQLRMLAEEPQTVELWSGMVRDPIRAHVAADSPVAAAAVLWSRTGKAPPVVAPRINIEMGRLYVDLFAAWRWPLAADRERPPTGYPVWKPVQDPATAP